MLFSVSSVEVLHVLHAGVTYQAAFPLKEGVMQSNTKLLFGNSQAPSERGEKNKLYHVFFCLYVDA